MYVHYLLYSTIVCLLSLPKFNQFGARRIPCDIGSLKILWKARYFPCYKILNKCPSIFCQATTSERADQKKGNGCPFRRSLRTTPTSCAPSSARRQRSRFSRSLQTRRHVANTVHAHILWSCSAIYSKSFKHQQTRRRKIKNTAFYFLSEPYLGCSCQTNTVRVAAHCVQPHEYRTGYCVVLGSQLYRVEKLENCES